MSQAGAINGGGGGVLPPTVATSYVTDNGTAIPAANILNVPGGTSTDNNVNGVQTDGTGNTLTVQLTNRAVGNVSTTGAVTSNIVSFTPPLVAGIYKLYIEIAAWDNTNSQGSTYELQGAVKADGLGGLATVGTPVRVMNGESNVFDVTQVNVNTPLGVINVTATGIAGRTIKWTGLLQFVFGGA